jgi:hypothetical protein
MEEGFEVVEGRDIESWIVLEKDVIRSAHLSMPAMTCIILNWVCVA